MITVSQVKAQGCRLLIPRRAGRQAHGWLGPPPKSRLIPEQRSTPFPCSRTGCRTRADEQETRCEKRTWSQHAQTRAAAAANYEAGKFLDRTGAGNGTPCRAARTHACAVCTRAIAVSSLLRDGGGHRVGGPGPDRAARVPRRVPAPSPACASNPEQITRSAGRLAMPHCHGRARGERCPDREESLRIPERLAYNLISVWWIDLDRPCNVWMGKAIELFV